MITKKSIVFFIIFVFSLSVVSVNAQYGISGSYQKSPSYQGNYPSLSYLWIWDYDIIPNGVNYVIERGHDIRFFGQVDDAIEPVYISFGLHGQSLTEYEATYYEEFNYYYVDYTVPDNEVSGYYDVLVESGFFSELLENKYRIVNYTTNTIIEDVSALDSPFQSLFVIVNQTTGTYINMTINSPVNMTYSSNVPLTINIDLSISTNGTNLIVYWNILQNGLWRLDNLTYPLYDQFTVSNNGTYTFYVWAIVDEGSLTNTVMFSSSIITGGGTSVSTGNGTLVPLIFALILILLSLIALVAKQPIIGIIIFIFSFAICGIFLINDVNMPYNPYSTIMVIFISLICMLINIIEKNT